MTLRPLPRGDRAEVTSCPEVGCVQPAVAEPAGLAFAERTGDTELFSEDCGLQTERLSQCREREVRGAVSTWASVTTRLSLGGFRTRHFSPRKSGGSKSEMPASDGGFLPQPLSPACR